MVTTKLIPESPIGVFDSGLGGLTVLKSLEKIWKEEKRKKYREHVSLNYYDYDKQEKNSKFNFKIGTINCPKEISRPELVLDVNYYKDYLFIKEIYENLLPKKSDFTVNDVIEWYDKKYSGNKKNFEKDIQ